MPRRRPPIDRDLRFHIYGRDRFRCRYCAVKLRFKTATLDHVIPWCKNGPSEEHNLVTCCRPCNKRKEDRLLCEIGWVLLDPGTRVVDLKAAGIETHRQVPNPPRKRRRQATRQRFRAVA